MIRAPDDYKRETLAGPGFRQQDDTEMIRVMEESRRIYERRQQRTAEFARLLSKLKRIGFYDTVVQKQYENIVSWCDAYYEDRPSSVKVLFESLCRIRWTLSEQDALDKIKNSMSPKN